MSRLVEEREHRTYQYRAQHNKRNSRRKMPIAGQRVKIDGDRQRMQVTMRGQGERKERIR